MVLQVTFGILITNCIVNDLTNNNFNLNIRWKWTFEKYDILIETKSDIQNVQQSTKARGPVFLFAWNFVIYTSLIDKISVLRLFFKSNRKERKKQMLFQELLTFYQRTKSKSMISMYNNQSPENSGLKSQVYNMIR